MAGHSQFKNIMHRKGRQDAVKSKLFGKLAREITVSAKFGLPDPAMNPRLRAAIIAARAENMPKDNIERAIKKASGGDAESYEEIRYEGYGPGGVALDGVWSRLGGGFPFGGSCRPLQSHESVVLRWLRARSTALRVLRGPGGPRGLRR